MLQEVSTEACAVQSAEHLKATLKNIQRSLEQSEAEFDSDMAEKLLQDVQNYPFAVLPKERPWALLIYRLGTNPPPTLPRQHVVNSPGWTCFHRVCPQSGGHAVLCASSLSGLGHQIWRSSGTLDPSRTSN